MGAQQSIDDREEVYTVSQEDAHSERAETIARCIARIKKSKKKICVLTDSELVLKEIAYMLYFVRTPLGFATYRLRGSKTRGFRESRASHDFRKFDSTDQLLEFTKTVVLCRRLVEGLYN